MAIIEASYGNVKIDNASNTLVDISAQVSKIAINLNIQTSTYYTLNVDFGSAISGKAAYAVDLEIYATDGSTDAKQLLETWATGTTAQRKAARTIEISVPDTAVGSTKYTGEVKLASISNITGVDAASTEPVRMMVRLIVDGALTKATIAS